MGPGNPMPGTSRGSEACGVPLFNGSEAGVQGPAPRSARTARSPVLPRADRFSGSDPFMEQAQRLQTFFTALGDTRRRNKHDRGTVVSRGWDMTKVLVADDFPLVREGFAGALARDPSIRVVGFAV